MTYRPKIYTASKIYHKEKWRQHRILWDEDIDFTARWIHMEDVPDHSDTTFWTHEQQLLHWHQDVQDVRRSDWLIAYKEKGDQLSGTLVECGLAIAYNIPIITVGFDLYKDSWTILPSVREADSIYSALCIITGRQL